MYRLQSEILVHILSRYVWSLPTRRIAQMAETHVARQFANLFRLVEDLGSQSLAFALQGISMSHRETVILATPDLGKQAAGSTGGDPACILCERS